jgi:hypothetical protein
MNFENNGAFHPDKKMLQLSWDSTSLGTFKECPRKYFFTMVMGRAPRRESVHLIFGTLYHSGLEKYDHEKAAGTDHEAAVLSAVRYTLEKAWNRKLGRTWVSDDPNKNLETLIRTIVWYLDQFKDDTLETVILANGKPAVELSFKFQTDYYTADGIPFMLCGHLDRLVTWDGVPFILDHKTTKSTIGEDFFSKFTPDNQFSLYPVAAKVVYQTPVKGIIVNGAQIAVNFSRFQRSTIPRSEDFLNEWYNDTGFWLKQAESCAEASYWPANDKSCGNYGGCPFRSVCSKPPSSRIQWLNSTFVERSWDPTISRGDI